MLLLGIILALIGCCVAVAVHRLLGLVLVVIGVILVVVALVDVDTADAVVTAGRSWS